ncbi:hypothetical protein [Thiothrix lacustris]|uniref:hypothetical protein n=1 Tax=Thiothrix lacustris TaxID=525917 RepID=UPI00048E77EE|nr:hypothetical protein [Thiothrix lacustris]
MLMGLNPNKSVVGLCGSLVYLTLGAQIAVAAPPEINIENLLKQAETACLQGDTPRLTSLSQRIRALAEQPALQAQQVFLNQLLGLFQAGVCQPGRNPTLSNRRNPSAGHEVAIPDSLPTTTKTSHLQVSAGYVDNVNQGSRHERITVTNPFNGLVVEGQLDKRNQPLSSPFARVEGTYRIAREGGDQVLTLSAARQEYTDEPDFSTTTLAVSGQKVLERGKETGAYLNIVRGDAGGMEQRLGGFYYQPLSASEQHKTGVNVGMEYVNYPEQKLYKSLVANVVLEHRKALNRGGELGVSGGLAVDHALEDRPGSDRHEVRVSGQWIGKPILTDLQPSVGVHMAYKLDTKPFDTKLYGDGTRTQVNKSIELGLSKKMGNNKLQMNYQYGRSQDKEILLYDQPASSAVGISFETNF